jgi:hypothetical protein
VIAAAQSGPASAPCSVAVARPDPVTEPKSPAPTAAHVDVWQRTSAMAERTWLEWWRTALTATAGALAVGRFAPKVLNGRALAVRAARVRARGRGDWAAAVRRPPQRALERSTLDGVHAPLPFRLVAFTIGGVLLVTVTVVLVGAQLSLTASARAQSALAPLMLPWYLSSDGLTCSYSIRNN